jgi:hypothetical protein
MTHIKLEICKVARQMLFAARLFGAPSAYFDKPNKIQKKLTEKYSNDMPAIFHRPINLKQLYGTMKYLIQYI